MRWSPPRALAALALAAVAAGCEGAPPTAVAESAIAPQLNLGVAGFEVTTLLVGAAEGSASEVHGPLQVWIGQRLPPNPCNEGATALQTIRFCGVLQNPGGETLQSGALTLGDPASPDGATTIPFRLTLPPNPCTTLLVRGALINPGPPGVETKPGPPTVFATFVTSAGALVGKNPGPPQVQLNPGPPQVQLSAGPPNAECTVSATASPLDG